MSTPSSHTTTAADLLTAALGQPGGPRLADYDVVAAHALLGQAAGTGSAYTSAETALDDCATFASDGGRSVSYNEAARAARAHAQLADRA